MDINRHKAIDMWGRKKYDLPDNATVEVHQETRYGGYCETCAYSYEVMEVYSVVDGQRTQIDTIETDLADLLRQILDDVVNRLDD